MGDDEDLFRTLTKLINLIFESHFLDRVFDCLDIHHSFVCEMIEQIIGFNGLLSSLFVAEDQIDPFMQVIRDICGLQSLLHDL